MTWRKLLFQTTALLLLFGVVNGQDTTYLKHENVIYGTVSGTALLMDVYKPSKSNGIGIVVIAGSALGYFHSRDYNDVPLKEAFLRNAYIGSFAKALVSKGYTIFMINHRYAPTFQFPVIFYDCQRAVRFIRYHAKKYDINADYIGATGHSSGATLSALLGVQDTAITKPKNPIDGVSSKVQAVVTLAASFVLSDVDKKADSAMKKDLVYEAHINYLGSPPETKNNKFILSGRYAQASPISYVSKNDAPFLIYHSNDDPIVPVRQASAFYQKLKDVGVATKLVLSPNQGHEPKPDMEEVDKWFMKNLQQK
jgi:acetyl esterase/lipase